MTVDKDSPQLSNTYNLLASDFHNPFATKVARLYLDILVLMVDKQQKLPKNNKLIRSHSGEIKRSLVTKDMLKYELLQLRIQFDVYLVSACIVIIGTFGYEPAEEYLFHGGFVTLGKHSP